METAYAIAALGYDYIIVGAGSAGCILANRLTEDPRCRVLLLEAGPEKDLLRIRLPVAAVSLWFDPALNWGYASEPQLHCDGRRLPIPRGKLLGGSSSINGMFFVRGHPQDYDHWQQLGAHGWGYNDVLPYFKSIETDWRGEGPFHGGSGALGIARCTGEPRLVTPLMKAVKAAGYPLSSDHNGAEPEGFGLPDLNIASGRRASSAAAFLKPVLRRRNLVVETDAHCTRIVTDKACAKGVEFLQNGQLREVRATREVILAAGAINSPQLLMLSGIGPAGELRELGITPVANLPGVGRNLQDHAGTGLDVRCLSPWGFERELRLDRFALSMVRWAISGSGPAASMPVAANAFIRTREGLDRPDLQMIVLTASPFAKLWFPGIRKPKGQVFTIRNILLHPESRGTITLASNDPLAKPRIDFNLLASSNDRSTLRESVRIARRLFATQPLAALCGEELSPGPSVNSDDEIDAHIRKTVGTFFHPAGTCAMGNSDNAVVDSALRVRGIDCLRVVDASVMPTLPGGNVNAPTMMIAEKASALITKQDARIPSNNSSNRASLAAAEAASPAQQI